MNLEHEPNFIDPIVAPVCHPLIGVTQHRVDLRLFWASLLGFSGSESPSGAPQNHLEDPPTPSSQPSLDDAMTYLYQWMQEHLDWQDFKQDRLTRIRLNGKTCYLRTFLSSPPSDQDQTSLLTFSFYEQTHGGAFGVLRFSQPYDPNPVLNKTPWHLSSIIHSHSKSDRIVNAPQGDFLDCLLASTLTSLPPNALYSALQLKHQYYHQNNSNTISTQRWEMAQGDLVWACTEATENSPEYHVRDCQNQRYMVWPQPSHELNGETRSLSAWSLSSNASLIKIHKDCCEFSPSPTAIDVFLLSEAKIVANPKDSMPFALHNGSQLIFRFEDSLGFIITEQRGHVQCWFDDTVWARELIAYCQKLVLRDGLQKILDNDTISSDHHNGHPPERTVLRSSKPRL